jgi:hypothetical protein
MGAAGKSAQFEVHVGTTAPMPDEDGPSEASKVIGGDIISPPPPAPSAPAPSIVEAAWGGALPLAHADASTKHMAQLRDFVIRAPD